MAVKMPYSEVLDDTIVLSGTTVFVGVNNEDCIFCHKIPKPIKIRVAIIQAAKLWKKSMTKLFCTILIFSAAPLPMVVTVVELEFAIGLTLILFKQEPFSYQEIPRLLVYRRRRD